MYDSKYEQHVETALNIPKNNLVKLSYVIEATYTPDFVGDDGTLYEAKGWFRPQDRRKMLAVRKANPGLRIVMVFQNPNGKISKGSKTTNAMWCEKHGFKWIKL